MLLLQMRPIHCTELYRDCRKKINPQTLPALKEVE